MGGGSAAFGAVDAYSDIDLNFIVDDRCCFDSLYTIAEGALKEVSPIAAVHVLPLGRYYKLASVGEFLLVDLCLFRMDRAGHPLEFERHGQIRPLFDKGSWLRPKPLDEAALAIERETRRRELQDWYLISQTFVRKAILRGQDIEALASFWGYTLRPLAELLRMRYCPVRWDFGGMRYLDRDLPSAVYRRFRDLVFVQDLRDLEDKLDTAETWGAALLNDLDPMGKQ